MAASPTKKITLKASDGEIFQIDEIVAHRSQTIHHMIEEDCAQSVIPLPNVKSRILSKVIEYCKKHVEPLAEEELKSWDADFVKIDRDFLFELILAANYLDIKELMDLTCQTVADTMKNFSVQQVRDFFNIENDFTAEEEEAAAREEHGWDFN